MGRQRDIANWDKTAAMCAAVYNAAPNFSKRPRPHISSDHFHPYRQAQAPRPVRGIRLNKGNIALLRVFLPDGGAPK